MYYILYSYNKVRENTVFIEKTQCISGTAHFKPMLFKDQLYLVVL